MSPFIHGAKVAVVGAGVSALFTAQKLSRIAPYATITIFCDGDQLPGDGASARNQKTVHKLGNYYLATAPDTNSAIAKARGLAQDAAELLEWIDRAKAFIGRRRGAIIALDREADELIRARFELADHTVTPYKDIAQLHSARKGVAAYESGDLTYDVFRLADFLGAQLTDQGHRILFNARADSVTRSGRVHLCAQQGEQLVAWDRGGKHTVAAPRRGWFEDFDVVVLAAGIGIPRIGGDWQDGSDLRFQTFQAGGLRYPLGDYRPYSTDVAYSIARHAGSDALGTFWALNADRAEGPETSMCLNEFTALWHDAKAQLPHRLGAAQLSLLARALVQDVGRAQADAWAAQNAMKPFECAKLNVWRAGELHQDRNTDVSVYRATSRVIVVYSGKATHATATGRQGAELIVDMLQHTHDPAFVRAEHDATWARPATALAIPESTVTMIDDDGFRNVWRGAALDGNLLASALALEDVGPELRASVKRWLAA